VDKIRFPKYRAWHIALNKMFSAEELGADQMTLSVDGRGFVNVHPTLQGSVFYGDKMIPLEYTGLKDKNGKEIYESDILRFNPTDDACLIIWRQICASFCARKTGWTFDHYFGEAFDSSDCEIIGNIYQNPELVEVKFG
jgi:uncharacterized phage protein (TIGR01671 family)